MKNTLRHLLLCCVLASAAGSRADELYESFRTPAAPTRPFVRWWWNGGRVDATELERELDVMRAAGIGGVEINTIGMPEDATAASLAAHPAVTWLSPEWCELVRSTAQAARDRGLTADLIVGSGWPFGGRFLAPAEQTQRAVLIKRRLTGPARLTLNRAELAALRPPRADDQPDPSPPPTRSELLFLRLQPTSATAGEFSPGRDLLPAFDAAGNLPVELPAGDHLLYVGLWQTGFTQVKLGAPGADGPVVNHFDAAAVRKYLDHMSARLAPVLGGRLDNAIRATFVDSLELDHANWTGDFAAEFARRRGYDLLPYLPYVLETDDPAAKGGFNDTVRRARYDFSRTLVELFDERFLATYVAWAAANGVKARIQAYGRESHPLHGSMRAELPEGETWLWLDPWHKEGIRVESTVVNKYVASAANLTGQRLRSFEAMTNAVPVFRETLQDFKRGLDLTLLDGLNHPILHGFNYTPPDAGFPGWVRFGDYLNERTPWWPYFHRFADYAARLGTVMRGTTAPARIAVLAPRPDEWARHGLLYQPFPEVADPWYEYKLLPAIQQAGFNVDYISEKILTDGAKQDGRLRYGPCAYDVIILEDVGAMEPAAADALDQFAAAGGRVVFIGAPPSRSPGLRRAGENDAQVRSSITRLRGRRSTQVQDEISPLQPMPATEGGVERALLGFATALLARTQLIPDVVFDTPRAQVSQIARRDGTRAVYFIANTDSRSDVTVRAGFPGAAGRPYRWDPEDGTRTPLAMDSGGRVRLELEPAGSVLIVFAPDENGAPPDGTVPLPLTEVTTLSGPWQVTLRPAGTSAPVIRTLPGLVDLSQVESDPALRDFGGTATYAIDFDGAGLTGATLDLGEVRDVSEVFLNGVPLGVRWWGRHRFQVASALHPGPNHLEIRVSTMLANLMRAKKDDPVAQRWAGWAPPIPAGLIGPVRLLQPTPATPPSLPNPQ
jgi:hypothetical protein